MNFSIVTPNDVYNWIVEKGNGNDSDYNKGKEDTQEAIEVFQSLYGMQLDSIQGLFNYLKTTLSMRVAESNSLYRAFIVLNNDEIMSIRFSQHPATRNSVTKAIKANGKPNLEYHLIVDRVKDINPHKDFYKDRTFKKVSFTIRDFTFSQLMDENTRKRVIDEIIYLLSYGTGNNNKQINTENKSMNTNKKVVRLTESQLRNMIQESVKRVLREDLEWDDDGYPINLPDDITEWASKVQNLCAELVQLKGKYRLEGNWDTLLKQLNNIDNTLNSACADLNTYGMSKHWSL